MIKNIIVAIIILLSTTAISQNFLISAKKLDSILNVNGVLFHKEFTYVAFCESGLQNKNLFGMHHPCCRKTYSTSQYGKVAKFDCIEDSIQDFLIWYFLAVPEKEETFVAYLKRRKYNPNEEYYKAINYVIQKNMFRL